MIKKQLQNIGLIALGIFSSLVLIFLMELAFRILPEKLKIDLALKISRNNTSKHKQAKTPPEYSWLEKDYNRIFSSNYLDKFQAYYGLPEGSQDVKKERIPDPSSSNLRIIATLKPLNKVLFDVVYSYDNYDRRIVPGTPDSNVTNNILMLGSSITHGDGVNDTETFPAFLQKKMRRSQVYNLGNQGGSLNDFVSAMRQDQKGSTEERIERQLNGLPKRNNYIVYFLTSEQIERIFCSANCYYSETEYLIKKSVYKLNESSTLEYAGTFEQLAFSDYFFRWFFAQSKLLKIFKLEWQQWIYASTDSRLVISLFAELKTQLEKKLQPKGFLIVYPSSPKNDFLRDKLHLSGWELLTYEKFLFDSIPAGHGRIPFDGHFTPQGNWVAAELLAKKIKELGWENGH